jgi:dolichyl-phosphate beta-glucosyltransferase
VKVSLIIPAFDEELRLPETLQKIHRYVATHPGSSWEIIVVDDGSSDGTRTAALANAEGLDLRVLRLPKNRGKGAAIRAGVLQSTGDRVLVSDADLSTPIEEWEKLAAAGASVAIGSRAIDETMVRAKQPWYRRSMGRTFNRLVRWLAIPGIRDTQCGFKLFEGELARQIFREARIDRFAYDVEILAIARRRGIAIAEVPVLWFNSPESKVAIGRDSLRMLWDLLRIRLGRGAIPPRREERTGRAR